MTISSNPYPFGLERTGYLVTDIDEAIRAAKATSADVLVNPFKDPIGRDAIIQWIGGVTTQLYWHTTAPPYASLESVPENRVYVSLERVEAFVSSFLAFSRGSLISDEPRAPDVKIGRPTESYRRVRIESKLGKSTALVTDGTEMAVKYFERTTRIDLSYALAWVWVSRVRNWQANVGLAPNDEGHRLAREALDRALALNPNLPEA